MAERRKNRRDQDLRDAVSLLPSAHMLKRIRFMPAEKDLQNILGDQLVEWSLLDDSDDIDDFLADKDIGPMNFYRACPNNAYLGECLEIAMARIGKRIKAKIKASHDYNMRRYLHHDGMARLERQEKLDADKNQTVTTIYKEEKIGIPVFGKNKK